VPRIYVGNLAESVTRDDLRALFSKIGRVGGALVITDKITGRSRGFGFVEMVEVEDAINAAVYSAAPSSKAAKSRSIHIVRSKNQAPRNTAASANGARGSNARLVTGPRNVHNLI